MVPEKSSVRDLDAAMVRCSLGTIKAHSQALAQRTASGSASPKALGRNLEDQFIPQCLLRVAGGSQGLPTVTFRPRTQPLLTRILPLELKSMELRKSFPQALRFLGLEGTLVFI